MSKIPSYVPEYIIEWVEETVSLSQSLLFAGLDARQTRIEEEQQVCAKRFVTNAVLLRTRYERYGHNKELFHFIFGLIMETARWKHEKKTSIREGLEVADEFVKHIQRALKALDRSSSVHNLTNKFLRNYLFNTILSSNPDVTKKGREALLNAWGIIARDYKVNDRSLFNEGYVNPLDFGHIGTHSELDIKDFLLESIAYINSARPSLEKKDIPIRKIWAKNSHITYATICLKDLFFHCNIPEHEHVAFITDLINAILVENDSEMITEDNVYKTIKQAKPEHFPSKKE